MDQQHHQQQHDLQTNQQQQQWQHYNVGQNDMGLPPQHLGMQGAGHLEAGPWRGLSDDPGQQQSGPGPPPPPPPSDTGGGPPPPQHGHPEQQGWGQDRGNYNESGPPGVPDQQELWPQEQEPAPPGSCPEPGPPPLDMEPPPPGHPFGMPQGTMGHEQIPANAPPPPPPPPPPGDPESWNRPPPPPDSGMHGFQPPPPPPPPNHQSLPTPVQLPAPIQLPPPQTLPAPQPPSPVTLPAPQPPPPGHQPAAPLPPPQGQEAAMPQQGELTQEQYNALTPEQQAEYWNQWHQNYSQYYNLQQQQHQQQPVYPGYEGYVDPQYQLYQQQQYQQYGVPQPGWEQYAQQPAYQQQMPPEAYMQAQQGYAPPPSQMPYGHVMPPQAAAPMAPFASMPLQGMAGAGYPAPGQVPASHGMDAHTSGAPLFPTGLGLQMPAQPKKPAVPEWLRAEMLKRGLSADGAGAPKKQLSDSDDESEPAAQQRQKFSDAGPGTRWQGPAGGRGTRGSDDESDSEAEEEARMMRINNEVKCQLTQLLLAVTDRMFEEVAEEVHSTATAPIKRQVPVSGAVVLMTEEGSDGPSGDVLGLGYGTDSDDEKESKPAAVLAAATKDETAEAAAVKPEPVVKTEEPAAVPAAASVKQEESPGENGGPSQGAGESSIKPEPKSEGVSSEPTFPKGSRVWYVDRGGSRIAATVEAVDTSHPPPSYTIRLDGAPQTRSTEGDRLQLMDDVPEPSDAGAGVKQEFGKDDGAGPGPERKPLEPLAAGLEEKASTSRQEAEGAERKRGVSAVKDETGKSKANGKDVKDKGAGKEEREKSKDKEKTSLKRKESDRERDKEKEKERQRAKEKEREREKEKERERERQREKAKEREREERERAHARQRDRDRRRKRGSSGSPSQSPSVERELDRRDSKRGRYGRSRSRSRDRRSRSSSRPRQRRASPKPARRRKSRSESPARRKGRGRSPSPASSSPPKVIKSKTGKESKSTKKDVQKSKK